MYGSLGIGRQGREERIRRGEREEGLGGGGGRWCVSAEEGEIGG